MTQSSAPERLRTLPRAGDQPVDAPVHRSAAGGRSPIAGNQIRRLDHGSRASHEKFSIAASNTSSQRGGPTAAMTGSSPPPTQPRSVDGVRLPPAGEQHQYLQAVPSLGGPVSETSDGSRC